MVAEIKGPGFGKRHIQSGLLFCLLMIAIGMRTQLSIAMVAMTESSTSPNPDVPVYDWNNKSTILSSFLWGYLWLQVLAGNMGRIYGSKYFLMAGMTVNALLSCLLPLMADKLGSYGVMACRVMQGLAQGFFYPNINNLISIWCPLPERATLGAVISAGSPFGNIVTLPLVGLISSSWYGWPLSFYLYGGAGFLWVIMYYFLGADSPEKHPTISDVEREYIINNLEPQDEKISVPWREILTSTAFWAIWINAVTQFWSWQMLLTEIPTYMNKIMKFDIQSNGILSATPYIASFLLMLVFGYFADKCITWGFLSLLNTRKIFNGISAFIPGTALLVLAFVPEDAITISIILLVIAVGVQSANLSGSGLNHIDIAPTFAGLLLGMVNSCGSLVSIFAPLAVQFVVQDEADKSQWRIIFYIATAMYFIPATLFFFYASADVQSFDPANKEIRTDRDRRNKKHSVISVISI